MATVSGATLVALAQQAGFGADSKTAAAVALAESGGDPNAIGHNATSQDFGLWQINDRAHPELFTKYTWNSPTDNSKMAYIAYHERGNTFAAWSAYNNGRYKAFLGQVGGVASATPTPGTATPAPASADAVKAQLAPLTNLATALTNPGMWARIFYFIGGTFLLFLGLHGLLKHSATYNKLVSTARKSVETAALA